MVNLDYSELFPNIDFENVRDILIFTHEYLEKNNQWDWFMELKFRNEYIKRDKLTSITDVEIITKCDNLIQLKKKLYAHCLNDTILLHTVLFLQENVKKGFIVTDFPLLVKNTDAIINPIHIK